MRSAMLAAFLILAACACSARIDEALVRQHVIAVGAEGQAVDPVSREELRARDFACRVQQLLRDADLSCDAVGLRSCRLVEEPGSGHVHKPVECRKLRRLLIHVHGGLNSSDSSLVTSGSLAAAMVGPGDPADWHYPFFVTWPSGFFESYGEHLRELRQGQHMPILGRVSAPYYFLRDLVGGLVNAPRTWLLQGTLDTALAAKVALDADVLPSWRNAEAIYDAVGPRSPLAPPVFPPGLRVRLGEYRRGRAAQGLRFLGYWGLLPLNLVATPLLLDGMGTSSWQVMVHRTHSLFRPAKQFERNFTNRPAELITAVDIVHPREGAFAMFLEELLSHMKGQEKDAEYELTLVGHSMGAIICCRALEVLPDLPVTNLVFMAPACTILEVERSVVPFLMRARERPRPARFHVLMLHPLAEADEISAGGFGPRGSLLEWVDNFFSTPTAHSERRFGKWLNAILALQIFAPVQELVTLKSFGVDGASLPQRHGDFNRCPFWKRSFWDPDDTRLYDEAESGVAVARDQRDGVKPESPSRSP